MTGDTGVSGMTGGSANTAGGDAGTAGDSADAFPSFEGQDLDGNPVDSATLFSNNAVTVVNFWFTTCKPCVGELPDLEALHQELAKKGGTVIGINAFTLDGSTKDTNEAKSVLEQQGVTYPNIWFASNSDAGLFTAGLYAFPTTYVVDRNGRGKSCRHCSGGEAGLPYFLPKSAGTSPHFSVSHFRILHL